MSIIKYRTSTYSNKIDAVEIVRETDKNVFFKCFRNQEMRQLKESSNLIYHDSWNEAHAHLIARTEYKIRKARETLEREEKALQAIIDMKPE